MPRKSKTNHWVCLDGYRNRLAVNGLAQILFKIRRDNSPSCDSGATMLRLRCNFRVSLCNKRRNNGQGLGSHLRHLKHSSVLNSSRQACAGKPKYLTITRESAAAISNNESKTRKQEQRHKKRKLNIKRHPRHKQEPRQTAKPKPPQLCTVWCKNELTRRDAREYRETNIIRTSWP